MEKHLTNIHALTLSLIAYFGMLIIALFYLENTYIETSEYPRLLALLTLMCVTFLTIILYQQLKVQDNVHALAKGMSKGMLARSQSLFSELYRSSPVPYILINESGMIESTNIAAIRLFNVEEGHLIGKDVFHFLNYTDSPKVTLIPEYYKQGKFISDLEVQIHFPDKTSKWVMLSLFSFHDFKGAKKGLLTLVDITKQKMIDRAKTEFVSLASHQLRTPLSAMKWNIELLESTGRTSMSETQAAYIKKIVRGLDRMDTLIRDFLSASKLELGTLTATPSQIELVKFLENICEDQRTTVEDKKIRLETDLLKARGLITTDPHLFHMVVSNIIGNAIKYTPVGGTVQLTAIRNEATVTISISDTGIGIPVEDQKMVFSKMFRASNARLVNSDGTGLGLYIVNEVVRVLGGTITFVSKEGAGTTFTITLRK